MNEDLFLTYLEDGSLAKIFKYFSQKNAIFKNYKTFENEYTLDNPTGAALKQFKDRLTTYYNSCMNSKIDGGDTDPLFETLCQFDFTKQVSHFEAIVNIDPLFETLCQFDFTKQVSHFEAIVNSDKSFISMVIRGDKDWGQEWLYSRIIKQYEAKCRIHNTIVIDFSQKVYNLQTLLGDLACPIGCKFSNNLSRNQRVLKNGIRDRLQTAAQFVVLKNTYSFIHSDEFASFQEMLTYFHEELGAEEDIKKCIFIFVEEQKDDYKHTSYCNCTLTKHIYEIKAETNFKFILLPPIEVLSDEVYKEWLGAIHTNYSCHFQDISVTPDFINPQIFLNLICQKLNTEYSKWLIK